MSKVDHDWERAMLERFKGRQNLRFEKLFNLYFGRAGLPKQEVLKCLQLLESEYRIPIGVLRPEDKLDKLLKPITAKTPWQWLVFRTREGDSATEINYELGKRMRQAGTVHCWSHIKKFGDMTILDLLRAWCGFTPDNSPNDGSDDK